MKRITLTEVDSTSSTVTITGENAVYVPGFACGESIVDSRVPTLCTSVAEFETNFGSVAPRFPYTQTYREYVANTSAGFSAEALATFDSTKRWFLGGTCDPAYVYAKELLTLGIPVIYERLNEYAPIISNTSAYSNIAAYSTTNTYSVGDYCSNYVKEAITVSTELQTGSTLEVTLADGAIGSICNKFGLSGISLNESHIFTCSVSGSTTTWTVDSEASSITLSDYGITASGTPVNNDKITISLSPIVGIYKATTATTTAGSWVASNWSLETNSTSDISTDKFYEVLMSSSSPFRDTTSSTDDDNELLDRDLFNIKYVTTGGYPNFEYFSGTDSLASKVATFASLRLDCEALIDHTDNEKRPLVGSGSVYSAVNSTKLAQTIDTYATMFTPWASYSTVSGIYNEDNNFLFPGSFGYFTCLAQVKLNNKPEYIPISGITNGYISTIESLHTAKKLTNTIAESYQKDPTSTDVSNTGVSINPISYSTAVGGYCIFGNRTLRDNAASRDGFALNFLQARNVLCDVKKIIFEIAEKYEYEPNSDILWLNFINDLTAKFDIIQANNGIKKFKIIQTEPTNQIKLSANIKIVPIYGIEAIKVNIALTNDDDLVVS